MREKRRKNIKKFFTLIILCIVIYYIFNTCIINNMIIAKSYNSNYSGTGQKYIKNKDGYFTTFITEEENQKIYNEYKQNGKSSWAKKEYWGGTMEENGCGITAMAIILSGYGFEITPEDLREKYFPVLDYSKLSNELSEVYGIKNSDFLYSNVYFSENKLKEHLLTNRPVLICVSAGSKNNRWTAKSHYMVLLAIDNKDMVYVSNPNGLKDSNNSSGWYKLDYVIPYIAKALFIESY